MKYSARSKSPRAKIPADLTPADTNSHKSTNIYYQINPSAVQEPLCGRRNDFAAKGGSVFARGLWERGGLVAVRRPAGGIFRPRFRSHSRRSTARTPLDSSLRCEKSEVLMSTALRGSRSRGGAICQYATIAPKIPFNISDILLFLPIWLTQSGWKQRPSIVFRGFR